ncbi:MAG: 3-isopropylmalate dehydrogenase [Lactobacillales bacterium]|jgi:3-isopropylmalate dehydrogenase|nr:3-isopropylmalate dehydrogenase [Lactobacillales bacterium]
MTKKITVLKGDGIGPEIMDAALQVLEVAVKGTDFKYELDYKDFGGIAIDNFGEPLPKETLDSCVSADAILLAAIGDPKFDQSSIRPEQGLLALRKELGLFANIRPIKIPEVIAHMSPLKPEYIEGVDFVMVRELTGGIYFGEPRELTPEKAIDTNIYTREEIVRIMRVAFEMALKRGKKVTSVDKQNVLATSKLWREIASEIALEYPEVTLEHQLVDSCAMLLITKPSSFDVIVTENLFGDVLSDEASVLPGSLGMMPSSSFGSTGVALYEPIHGSAPDIKGQNVANPMSMILSVTMMLRDSFDEEQLAQKIEAATDAVLGAGIKTRDLGGTASTSEFTQAVIAKLA